MAINRKVDYSSWSKSELIKEIQKLNKRKKYGLIWDEERTKEIFEEEVQQKLPVLKDVTKNGIEDNAKPNNILIVRFKSNHSIFHVSKKQLNIENNKNCQNSTDHNWDIDNSRYGKIILT